MVVEPRAPSRTAVLTAAARALHREEPQPWVLDDQLALALAGDDGWELLALMRSELSPEALLAFSRWVCVRARLPEDIVEGALADGVRQYVVLGAGLDRAPVDDDAGGLAAVGGEDPTQRHPVALPGCRVGGRHVLDGELDLVEPRSQPTLEPGGAVEDEVVEPFPARYHRRDGRPGERATDTAAAAVPTRAPGAGP